MNFGTSEEPAMVPARDLEPGVYVDGDTFGFAWSGIIEWVRPQEDGTVWVCAYQSEQARYSERVWRPDRLVQTWGKLGEGRDG
jgi:hypothetical protein